MTQCPKPACHQQSRWHPGRGALRGHESCGYLSQGGKGSRWLPVFSYCVVPWWAVGARNQHYLIQSEVRRFQPGSCRESGGGGRGEPLWLKLLDDSGGRRHKPRSPGTERLERSGKVGLNWIANLRKSFRINFGVCLGRLARSPSFHLKGVFFVGLKVGSTRMVSRPRSTSFPGACPRMNDRWVGRCGQLGPVGSAGSLRNDCEAVWFCHFMTVRPHGAVNGCLRQFFSAVKRCSLVFPGGVFPGVLCVGSFQQWV